MKKEAQIDKDQALHLLVQSNKRFCSEKHDHHDLSHKKRTELAENGQSPYALIVCCSDSRVPPEIIFDCGLGDLFVVRTAGNVVDDVCMGSIEYGAEHLNISLIVVLGHEGCGAVQATVNGGESDGCLSKIIERISVSLKAAEGADNIYAACEDENIRSTVQQIKENHVISGLVNDGKVMVIGAKYGLRDGIVSFFDA